MEEFLASDVARAVYGYLLSEGCEEAAKVFLETSANLSECKQRVKNGKKITLTNTLLLGRNLTELLNIACSVHSLVLQANKKQQTGEERDEGWTHLFDELRSFILAECTSHLSRDDNNSNSQISFSKQTFLSRSEPEGYSPLRPVSQSESQNSNVNSQILETPKRPSLDVPARVSLAENYKNLVEECHKGLDLSLSPDKNCSSNKNELSSSRLQPSKQTFVPESLSCPELEVNNQSAVAAIAGIASEAPRTHVANSVTSNLSQILLPGPNIYQVVSSVSYTSPCHSPSTNVAQTATVTSSGPLHVTSICSSLPLVTLASSLATYTPSAVPVSFATSQPGATAVTSCFPQPIVVPTHSGSSGFQLDGITRLPDPPIIILNEQNQQIMPFDSNDPSASFFGLSPSAASTPHPSQTTHFAPQDTAIIIYPPLVTDLPQKKTQEPRTRRPIRSTKLRKLLPKPPRKDPPDIVHIKILPQQILSDKEDKDSLSENPEGDYSDNGLAEELPNISIEDKLEIIVEEEEVPTVNGGVSQENSVVVNESKNKEEQTIQEETVQETSLKDADVAKKKNEVKTPKPPLIRKNISRSTPRRNSHVRALSFNTPHKPMLGRKANTSPKMPKIQISPRSSKFEHVKRSSLFKSPPSPKPNRELSRLTEEDENEESDDDDSRLTINSRLAKVPIATRSPAPKLSSAWQEVNDVTITEKSVKKSEKSIKTTKKQLNVTDKPSSNIHKPQWDDTIRSFICGDFVNPVPPPKKQFKKKPPEKSPDVKKAAVRSKNNVSSIRRSSRLSNTSESPVKDSLRSKSKCKTKPTPQKLKNNLNSQPSQPVVNKKTKKFLSKSVKKRSKKIVTPSILSTSEDSDSSRKGVSKSVTVNSNRGITSPNSSKALETIASSPECRDSQFLSKSVKKRNKKIITPSILSTSEDSDSSSKGVSKSVTVNSNRGITSPNSSKALETIASSPECCDNQLETCNSKENVNKGSFNNRSSTNNILLEDLGLSSNSCFPPAAEDSIKEQVVNNPTDTNHTKLINDPTDQLKPNGNSNKVSLSPKFALPFIPVQGTPMKDIQAVLPATPVLNTPFIKNIMQETSVLEEDLLLTPSLPPTPQVVSPHHLGRTPSRHIEAQENVAITTHENYYSPSQEHDERAEAGTGSQVKIFSIPKTTNVNVPEQKISSETSSDSILDCPDKITLPASQNRSSSTSKNNLTSSSETSDEEIVKTFLNRPIVNQSTFQPTIKTRIIQGPVSTKPKGYINNRKIYTTTDSSDEENNDNNTNKAKCNQINQESNQNMSNLMSMLMEKERNRIERLSKKDGVIKKRKAQKKIKSQAQNKTFGKDKSRSIRSAKLVEETKVPVHQNKSPTKAKPVSPKEKNNKENDRKVILTPEKVREQLESDLLKIERQNIFGDDFQLSSDSDSELEVFDRKKQINKPKPLIKANSKERVTNQDMFLSDDSSNEVVYKKSPINSSKSVRFETTTTEIRMIEKSSSVCNTSEAAANAKAFSVPKSIPEITDELANVDRIKEAVSVVAVVNSPDHCSNPEINNALNTNCNNIQSESLGKKVLLDERCSNTSQSQASVKDNSCGVNKKDNSSILCGKSTDLLQSVLSSSSGNEAMKKDKLITLQKSGCVSESSLPKTPKPCLKNCLPQCDNSSTVIDNKVSNYVNEIDKSEAHISVISNDCTRKNTKHVSLNLPQFEPDYQIGFETDNGTISLSYSKTIFHLEMSNKTDQDILKRNIRQESLKMGRQQPSKGIDGKRRVKLTPVEEGKYEKLKVDYDIIDGKVISKREERRKSSEMDILDFTCSTIDSIPDSSPKNRTVSFNGPDFKGQLANLQDNRKKYENKDGLIETTSDVEHTKTLSQSSSSVTSQPKYKTNKNEIISHFMKTPNKQNETIKKSLYSTKISEASFGQEMAKLKRKNADEPFMQNDENPEYEYSKTELYKRKEAELKDRRKERDILVKSQLYTRKDAELRDRRKEREIPEGSQLDKRKEAELKERRKERGYPEDYHLYRRKEAELRDRRKEIDVPEGSLLDKRKEADLRERRKERYFSERFDRKDQSKRYLPRREEHRERYFERRHHTSPGRYHRSHLNRRRDPDQYYRKTPPWENYDRDPRYSERRRETNRFSNSSTNWKDVDDVKEKENKSDSEEERNEVFDPRAEQQQLTSYSDVEKNSSSDGADSLMDFAVLTKSKRKKLPPNSSQNSPVKEALVRSGQSSKRRASSSGEDISQTSQANKKLKMEEKDMREAKSVLKHKMADMLNVLHPDNSNEAS